MVANISNWASALVISLAAFGGYVIVAWLGRIARMAIAWCRGRDRRVAICGVTFTAPSDLVKKSTIYAMGVARPGNTVCFHTTEGTTYRFVRTADGAWDPVGNSEAQNVLGVAKEGSG